VASKLNDVARGVFVRKNLDLGAIVARRGGKRPPKLGFRVAQ